MIPIQGEGESSSRLASVACCCSDERLSYKSERYCIKWKEVTIAATCAGRRRDTHSKIGMTKMRYQRMSMNEITWTPHGEKTLVRCTWRTLPQTGVEGGSEGSLKGSYLLVH